jgi:hypothetical protein
MFRARLNTSDTEFECNPGRLRQRGRVAEPDETGRLDLGMGEDIAKLALTVPKDARLLSACIVPCQHWPIPPGLPACFGSSPSEERESPEPTFSNTTF